MHEQSIHLQQVIRATPESIRGAFTREFDLQLWLCNGACFPRRIEGPFLLWWANGSSATGRFLPTDSESEIRFAWQENDAPPCEVLVSLKCNQKETTVNLTVQYSETTSTPDRAKIQATWDDRLRNLSSIWSMTGIDRRLAKQPSLGLLPGEPVHVSNEEQDVGVPILKVLEGSSAEQAGLHDGDILLKISKVPITAHTAFPEALAGKEAGEKLTVLLLRNKQLHVREMTLLPRPPLRMPPESPADFADESKTFYESIESRIAGILGDCPESLSNIAPEPGAWSVNAILAHLILLERLTQDYIAHCRLGYFETHMPQVANLSGRIEAVVETIPSRAGLLESLHQSLGESLALLRELPSEFASHPAYITMGQALILDQFHYVRHVEQLERTTKQLMTST